MITDIKNTIKILKKGGIGIFPTDTVFGIGCRLDIEQSIQRIFSVRHRPAEKAVIALVSSVAMAQEYLLPIPQRVQEKLISPYWPGGLTIVLPCQTEKVPPSARANRNTLAVRQTNNPVLLEILRELRVPLIAPSANVSGGKVPINFTDIDKELLQNVDFAINEPTGGSGVSTIIDCSVNPWKIIREGVVQVSL